jgi:threonine/homoserine/homoserine lactone efflux protein
VTTAEFVFAVAGLLLTPGPTNTLLALSGAAVGLRQSLRLIPAEFAGYLLVVVPLALFGAGLFAAWPVLGTIVKLGAAIWVMILAVRLWWPPAAVGTDGLVMPGRVFFTTLLNPKGLVFGLVLLPRPDAPEFVPHLALFCAMLPVVATIWMTGGTVLGRDRSRIELPPALRRAAACWLAILSVVLVVRTLSA